jgi:hypothetical protein
MSGGREQAITHTESATEIQINIYRCREKPYQHDIRAPAHKPCMATFYNDITGSIRIPPLPSGRLPCDTSHWAICGWPIHYADESALLQRRSSAAV